MYGAHYYFLAVRAGFSRIVMSTLIRVYKQTLGMVGVHGALARLQHPSADAISDGTCAVQGACCFSNVPRMGDHYGRCIMRMCMYTQGSGRKFAGLPGVQHGRQQCFAGGSPQPPP